MPDHALSDTFVNIREAAELLGCSVRTVERLQADGSIAPVYERSVRGKARRRFRRGDIEALAAAAQVAS